jgi:uncharacterized protein (DUF885 family)
LIDDEQTERGADEGRRMDLSGSKMLDLRKFGRATSLALVFLWLSAPLKAFEVGNAPTLDSVANQLQAHLLATQAYVRFLSKLPVEEFDELTYERAREDSKFNKKVLAQLDAISTEALPHDQWVFARILHHALQVGSGADRGYWFKFAVTPYAGQRTFSTYQEILASQPLRTAAERDGYLRLLDSYSRALQQVATKTRLQAERGIRLPLPAIPQVVAAFKGMRASATDTFMPGEARLANLQPTERQQFELAIQKRISDRLVPRYDSIVGIFDDDYRQRAPTQVGLGQYPGGKQYYRRLISDYTGLELEPQAIRELGAQRVAALEQRMAAIRRQLGFAGSREAFQESLRHDPRFIAATPAEVEARYSAYVERMKPLLTKYFAILPKAGYGLRRLPASSEGGMTYGFYKAPTPVEAGGYYYYNGSQLDQRSLVTAEHLMLHELIPGHHLQQSLEIENETVHSVRKFLGCSAFDEGWGEYAASLGEEAGLYSDPYDLYGHLLMQSFLASHLVVDTDMNYFGVPLEAARSYMHAHTFESDLQIDSETLAYSTDIYAYTLSYWLGYEKFWELRHRAEHALGRRFDIRKFHTASLSEGSMTLDVLEGHIKWFIGQQQKLQP